MPVETRTCQSCGQEFTRYFSPYAAATGRGKYCSKSCSAKTNSIRHGHAKDSGLSRTYTTWAAMLQRCENPKQAKYPRYGGAGIKVCDAWHDFQAFLNDMGERPDGKTIDRIDGSKGYSPDNCRWATPLEQQRNIKTNRMIMFNGRNLTVSEVSRLLGINFMTLTYRIKNWPESEWFRPAEQGRPLLKRSSAKV